MADKPVKCVEPAGGPVGKAPASPIAETREVKNMDIARVGAKAPDFATNAYLNGGFISVKLSDYAGKWTVLCFYPGDFTFV